MTTVTEGRSEVVKLIGAGLTGNEFDSVAIGTSGAARSDADGNLKTTLDSQTALTAGQTGNTMSLVGTFTGNSASVREASAYESTSQTMLCAQVVDTIKKLQLSCNLMNVESSDTLEVTGFIAT